MMNLMKSLEMKSLKATLGLETYDAKQKKAIKNIKYCANDQWQFVNSYIDGDDEIRPFLLDASNLFSTIYNESQENIYDEGCVHFGGACASFLKDIRFCGKEFLQKVTLYYTAKLMEDIFAEVDATEEEQKAVLETLMIIKNEISGKVSGINFDDLKKIFKSDLVDGNDAIEKLATEMKNVSVRNTKKNEKWFYMTEEDATVINQFFQDAPGYVVSEKGNKIEIQCFSDSSVKFILKMGKKAYIWCIA